MERSRVKKQQQQTTCRHKSTTCLPKSTERSQVKQPGENANTNAQMCQAKVSKQSREKKQRQQATCGNRERGRWGVSLLRLSQHANYSYWKTARCVKQKSRSKAALKNNDNNQHVDTNPQHG